MPEQDTQTIQIYSPLDNQLLGSVPRMHQQDIDAIFTRLQQNQDTWAHTPLATRAAMLHNVADALESRAEEGAQLLMKEIGKPYPEAKDEMLRTGEDIRYFAEEGLRMEGLIQTADAFSPSEGSTAMSFRFPLGIVLAIPPFNYPINESAPKIVGALIGGNSVVVKPSLQGVLSFHLLLDCFRQAGFSEDILAVITGDTHEIGDYLVSHDAVNAINFTGSYETAKHIHQVMKPVKFIAGLSGKDASIVCNDADLDLAVSEIAQGAFLYSGQRCTAIKRVLVEDTIADTFIEKLKAIVQNYKVGDVRHADVTHGPVISVQTAEYAAQLLADAREKGADIIIGGTRSENYMDITIVDHVSDQMRIAWEEPFAPILPIFRVADAKAAIAMANRSEYGLQASIFSKDTQKAMEYAMQLEVGRVTINGRDARGPDNFPFTGVKHSGLGYLSGARFLIEETTYLKTIVFNLNLES